MAHLSVQRSFSLVAQEELICPLCYELFSGLCEPKELDCAHVFCQICLLRIVGIEPSIVCPECRHVTNVPPGGVASMKCILRLRNLADKYAKHCNDLLERRRSSTPHLTPRTTDVATCPKHVGEKMYFLCVTCNIPICQFCLVRNHTPPTHDIQEIKTSREELQIDLQNAITDADAAKAGFEEDAKAVTDLISRIESALENEFTAIDDHVIQVVEEVRKCGERLKDRVRQMEEARLASFREERERLEERVHLIEVTQDTARKTRANLPDHVYTTRYKPLVKKLQLLCSDGPSDFNGSSNIPKFVKDASSLEIQLGRVEMQVRVKPVAEFGKFEFARAIAAVSGSEGFAVTDFYGKQIVFFKDNGSYKEHTFLELKDRKYGPTDVAITDEGNYLLATWVGIEMFTPAGMYKSAFAADQGGFKDGVYSVTTTPDSRVLVGNIEHSTITIHNSDGELLKTLKVDIQPYNIATNGKQVAISQEVTNTIAVVGLDSGEELLRIPVEGVNGLCYDDASNSLLVGKTVSNVHGTGKQSSIEQYCADTGRWIGQVVGQLYSPQALALAGNGTLAVADRKTVKVFQML